MHNPLVTVSAFKTCKMSVAAHKRYPDVWFCCQAYVVRVARSFDRFYLADAVSSDATVDIALEVIGTHRPFHHDDVGGTARGRVEAAGDGSGWLKERV